MLLTPEGDMFNMTCLSMHQDRFKRVFPSSEGLRQHGSVRPGVGSQLQRGGVRELLPLLFGPELAAAPAE